MLKKFHIIFTKAHPSRFSHRWNVYDLRKKERPLGVHGKHPRVPVEMLPQVIYEYCLMIVWLVVILNMIVSSIGVLVSVFRLCQKIFLSRRKRLNLNQLELYQKLRSSHINKFYEINRLMSGCYQLGEQVEIKSFEA